MSYDRFESDDRSGGPITLYEFTVGPGPNDQLRYTDADTVVFHEKKKWHQLPISRGEIVVTGTLERSGMEIEVPMDAEIARMWVHYPPSFVVTLRILEGHFADKHREFRKIWGGRVLNCGFDPVSGKATLSAQLASTSLKRPGLRRHYQRQCPLELYGPECRATKAPVEIEYVSSEKNVIVGVIPGGGFPTGIESFVRGVLSWVSSSSGRTEMRSILVAVVDATNVTLTTTGPIFDVPEVFSILKGCLHNERTCINWHDNINNYGGHPWIPLENPINNTSVFI